MVKLLVPWLHWNARHRPSGLEVQAAVLNDWFSKTGRLVVDSPWVVDGWCLMVSMILGVALTAHGCQIWHVSFFFKKKRRKLRTWDMPFKRFWKLFVTARLVTGARIYTSASHPFLGWDPSLFKKHQWSQKRLRCSVMRRCESQECDSTQLGGGFKFFFIFTTASVVVYWKIFASNDATVLWLKKLRVFQKSSFGVSENVSLDTKVQRHTYNIYTYYYIYIYIWYISIYYKWYIFIVCYYNNACLLFC